MRALRLASALLLVLAVASCAGVESTKPDPLPSSLQRLFEYDRDAPLAVRWGRGFTRRGITVRELSYAAPGGRVPAILARPTAAGRHPAVIIMHGSGGSRTDFLPSAALLATKGTAALA